MCYLRFETHFETLATSLCVHSIDLTTCNAVQPGCCLGAASHSASFVLLVQVIFGAAPDQALLLSIAVAGPMVLVTFASEFPGPVSMREGTRTIGWPWHGSDAPKSVRCSACADAAFCIITNLLYVQSASDAHKYRTADVLGTAFCLPCIPAHSGPVC